MAVLQENVLSHTGPDKEKRRCSSSNKLGLFLADRGPGLWAPEVNV